MGNAEGWAHLVQCREKPARKDGDHYWVKATATPTPDGGFMSVRVKPTRAEVRDTEALIQRMRDSPGIRLAGGRVKPSGLMALLQSLNDLHLIPNCGFPHCLQCLRFLSVSVWAGWR